MRRWLLLLALAVPLAGAVAFSLWDAPPPLPPPEPEPLVAAAPQAAPLAAPAPSRPRLPAVAPGPPTPTAASAPALSTPEPELGAPLVFNRQLNAACEAAITRCQTEAPVWLKGDLDPLKHLRLARTASGVEVQGLARKGVRTALERCAERALAGTRVEGVALNAPMADYDCRLELGPPTTRLPSTGQVKELLNKCLPGGIKGELTVGYAAAPSAGAVAIDGVEVTGSEPLDAYAQRCIQLGLERRIPFGADEGPAWKRARFQFSFDGKSVRTNVKTDFQ